MAKYQPDNPVIVQGDRTVLVEVSNPLYSEIRGLICRFAQLEKSPEYLHTYRLTPLSIWNAASVGMSSEEIVGILERYSKYDVPVHLKVEICEFHRRFGLLTLVASPGGLELICRDPFLMKQISLDPAVKPLLGRCVSEARVEVPTASRGLLKQTLVKMGYPVDDRAGYTEGAPFEIALREQTRQGGPFEIRPYQREAADLFCAAGELGASGSGVIVLPCGAGKTIVALAIMATTQCRTLILTTGITAIKQWRRELLDKTFTEEQSIGEYTGETKDIKPITLSTYQILTHRHDRSGPFRHFDLFTAEDWGLIVYDEVHLLPAQIFRVTADLQARRRLGLTATLVREDGKEEAVFSLIGPKKYDVPWKSIEQQGWIAPAVCNELRIPFDEDRRLDYARASQSQKIRLAAENPMKRAIVSQLAERHRGETVLLIGHYLGQLNDLADQLQAPIITGQTPAPRRECLYEGFRRGEIPLLVVSKVGNFSVDLPDASVLIQVSGTFGSRQEEAQRLGRILRPKKNGSQATFYSLVTSESVEQRFSEKRQLFLTEQGYAYRIVMSSDLKGSQ